jgi:hypothetical protein
LISYKDAIKMEAVLAIETKYIHDYGFEESHARFVQLYARILLTSGVDRAIHLQLDQQLTGRSRKSF